MINSISHITTVHYRHDVRIMYKYCQTLSEQYQTRLFVADGKGSENIGKLKVLDIGKPSFGRIGRLLTGNLKMFLKVLGHKADILHFHDPELLPLAFLMRILGRKVVFDMHENLPLEILTKDYIPKFIRVALSRSVKLYQQFVLYFIPVIYAEKSYGQHFTSAKRNEVILNYPLIGAIEDIKVQKKPEFTLGYMGGVTIERGAMITLDCAASLRKENGSINLLFVGPFSEEISSLGVFKDAKANGWAEFCGRLKPHEGWSKMCQCHVGLAILQDSPNFVESYPTKIFEYMLLGLPIIVSNFPLYAAIVDESNCGIAVNPSSQEEVAGAMKWMLNNPEEAIEMGARGKQKAIEKYSWESEFSKLIHFYETIIS